MPTNAKTSVYKEKEFQMYVLWKSLPAFFRAVKKEQLIAYGLTNPLILKVSTIKTQTEFAKNFNIKDLGTLTDWNDKIEKNNLVSNSFDSVLKTQFSNLNNESSLKQNTLLNKKLLKQQNIISRLKIENDSLKKKQIAREQKSASKIINTPVSTPPVGVSIPKQSKTTILQKIKSSIFRWR